MKYKPRSDIPLVIQYFYDASLEVHLRDSVIRPHFCPTLHARVDNAMKERLKINE